MLDSRQLCLAAFLPLNLPFRTAKMDSIKIVNDLVYDLNHNLKLDLYNPINTPRGVIMVIHGGGWFQGDKSKDADIATLLATAGYLIIVPNYRLAPEFHYPAPLEDMDLLIKWYKSSPYFLKTTKMGIFGSSAGGNIAIETGLKYGLPVVSRSGVIDIDIWMELHLDVKASKEAARDGGIQSGKNDALYKWAILNYTAGDPEKIKMASLLNKVSSKAGPMLLVNSLNEFCPVDAVYSLSEKLINKAGVDSCIQLIPGTKHAKGYLDKALPFTLDFYQLCFSSNRKEN